MGRDKRMYRFVQDTRFGRIVLAEIARYLGDRRCRHRLRRPPHDRARARTMVVQPAPKAEAAPPPPRSRVWPFVLGFIVGAVMLFGIALLAVLRGW